MTFNKKIDRLESGSNEPQSPNDEVIWVNTSDDSISRYDEISNQWVNVGGSSGVSIPETLEFNTFTNLAGFGETGPVLQSSGDLIALSIGSMLEGATSVIQMYTNSISAYLDGSVGFSINSIEDLFQVSYTTKFAVASTDPATFNGPIKIGSRPSWDLLGTAGDPSQNATYSPSDVPGAIVTVIDKGYKPVYSDGTNWRYVHDNSLLS